MDQSDEIIYYIIAAQLSGEALSSEERLHLDEWLKDPHNRKIYEELAGVYDSRERVVLFDRVETPEDFRAVLSKNDRRRHSNRRWLKYAAVLIPLAVMSLLTARWMSGTAGEVDLNPGVVRAILMTEKDEQVLLSDAGGLVCGGIISKGGNQGLLKYESGTTFSTTHTIMVERGGEYQLELADGTKVWLNSETELSYPTDFHGKENRRVRLRGEAYFEVASSETQPFIVDLSEGSVTVLGTHFNISSYANDEKIVTTLLEGSVRYNNGTQQLTLTPGQICTFDKERGYAEVTNFNLSKYALWKDGLFVFENISMEELGRQISRWYNIEVRFDNPAVGRIAFTGAMERYKPASYILRMLEETNTVKSRFEGDELVFSMP